MVELLRLRRRVDVLVLVRPQLLGSVVQRRVNNTVPNCLGNDVLRVLLVLQLELLADVGDRDTRVCDVDFAQASLDDVVAQPVDQRELTVGEERRLVLPARRTRQRSSF